MEREAILAQFHGNQEAFYPYADGDAAAFSDMSDDS